MDSYLDLIWKIDLLCFLFFSLVLSSLSFFLHRCRNGVHQGVWSLQCCPPMIRYLVMESIENFKCLCELHRGNNKDQIKEMTEIRKKRNKQNAILRRNWAKKTHFKRRVELNLKNWHTLFFIFLLSSVISLILSSSLPQWSSQRRLKSSILSTYNKGFSKEKKSKNHWKFQTSLWSPLRQQLRPNQGDDKTKEKNKKSE